MYSINSTNRDLAELRSMQDWYLKYQLTSVEGVSEVASVGGFVKQYQVTVDPTSCAPTTFHLRRQHGHRAQQRRGGRPFHRTVGKEFILRVGLHAKPGRSAEGRRGRRRQGRADSAAQVANVQFGPDMRRGIAELNGEGETVGGIVVVRYGANAARSSRT
jgi:Cu(I)/Ag(I) efflux system membrane protein CusA/SilA